MGAIAPDKQIIAETMALLDHYCFEFSDHPPTTVMHQWCLHSTPEWIRLAVLEALYRGRYKAISVTAILKVWHRLGEPQVQFDHDFETLICAKLPAVPPESDATVQPSESATENTSPSELGITTFAPPAELSSSDAYQKLKAIAAQKSIKH